MDLRNPLTPTPCHGQRTKPSPSCVNKTGDTRTAAAKPEKQIRIPFILGPMAPRGGKRVVGPTKAAVRSQSRSSNRRSTATKPSAVGIGIANLAWVKWICERTERTAGVRAAGAGSIRRNRTRVSHSPVAYNTYRVSVSKIIFLK